MQLTDPPSLHSCLRFKTLFHKNQSKKTLPFFIELKKPKGWTSAAVTSRKKDEQSIPSAGLFLGVGERGEIDRRPILQQLVARPGRISHLFQPLVWLSLLLRSGMNNNKGLPRNDCSCFAYLVRPAFVDPKKELVLSSPFLLSWFAPACPPWQDETNSYSYLYQPILLSLSSNMAMNDELGFKQSPWVS